MYRIGIDLGGTNIKIGIVDNANAIVAQDSVPTKAERPAENIVNDMVLLINNLLEKNGITLGGIVGIGVGSPGAIDAVGGIVIYSNNFGWENVPLLKLLHDRLPLPAAIANDAQCAALGEQLAGAGEGCADLILITLGTGVGGGIVVDGKLFTGGSGGGVIGHMVIVEGGEPCTCGRKGCLEAYASATALIRETHRAIGREPNSLLTRRFLSCRDKINGHSAFDAAADGDPAAQDIISKYVESLGNGITNLVNVFRPKKILLGGGVGERGNDLLVPLNAYIQKNSFAGDKLFIPPVEKAKLGNMAGIIGAASLVPSENNNSIRQKPWQA